MNKQHNILDIAFLSICLFIAGSVNAHAYIDPGSGGVLITAILGFFAAIGYTFRKWFYRLRNVFGNGKSIESKFDEDEDEDNV